ncbi:MAG: nitroreductase family protein [Verrucomicrobia bacterium]|nr:nitroreductase family protein [Verrucomicrobiota bacterium]MCF7708386.1 nitroreductase family protein [Verrucomicrobiota bacterium]
MDIYETINARHSIRNYKPDAVEDEKLSRIWTAVRFAPSACNLQPWKFLVVRSDETKRALKGLLQEWLFTAPMIIIGLGNTDSAWRRDGESIHQVDVAIAMQHLMLAAAHEGLGTCWIGAFNRRAVSKALNLDAAWEPVAVTPLGYPNEKPRITSRKPVEEIIEEI